jgi:hypothetical protein
MYNRVRVPAKERAVKEAEGVGGGISHRREGRTGPHKDYVIRCIIIFDNFL